MDPMSDILPKIGTAIEAFKSRQQDINGLGQRAYKDLFAAANAALLTSVVQDLIQQSHADMITPNAPRTSLLAAISQHHSEIITGCRVLTDDDGIQRALIDAANAATMEAFRMIYAASPRKAEPVHIRSRARKTAETVDQTSYSESAEKAPKRVGRRTKKSS
jgi:hypothetical protein